MTTPIPRSPFLISKFRALVIPLLLVGAGAFLSACVTAPRWQIQHKVTPELVARTLDEPGHVADRPEDVPEFPVRVQLRPCCAFGTELQASVGPIPVPFFSIENITSVDELGPHMYDSGAFSVQGSSTKNAFSSEKNGLIYTCRGGFIVEAAECLPASGRHVWPRVHREFALPVQALPVAAPATWEPRCKR